MITETLMGGGELQIPLGSQIPRKILDAVEPSRPGQMWANLVITAARVDPKQVGTAGMLDVSKYSGIVLGQDELTLTGVGANAYMGKIEDAGLFNAGSWSTASGTFAQWVATLRPSFLSAGITSLIGGTHTPTYPRTHLTEPLQAVCDRFGAEWRVRPSFKLDFGLPADLFQMNPLAVVTRRAGDGGRETSLIGIPADASVQRDASHLVRRLIYQYGDPPSATTASVGTDAAAPMRAPDGSALIWTAHVTADASGSEVQLAAAELGKRVLRQSLTLSTLEYDFGSAVKPGDMLAVYDPAVGLVDESKRVYYRGDWMSPVHIRCMGLSWPIREGMGVYVRRFLPNNTNAWDSDWIDLTEYVDFETGDATVDVGALPRLN